LSVPSDRLKHVLAEQTSRSEVHPVFFGSAITGAGVDALMAGISELLPSAEGDVDGQLSATVFKIERGSAAEKIAYLRLFSGSLRTRDKVRIRHDDHKITRIGVFEHGGVVQRTSVSAGEVAMAWGLSSARIGDELGLPRRSVEHHFDPPTLEAVVVPERASESGALHVALTQLAEQDPLINLRQDDVRRELSVSLYGEVQKEVIQATLAADYGIDVVFRETTVICVERPVGVGEASEAIGDRNPFLATVGLRIEPGEPGSGIEFRLEAPLETIPLFVYRSVEAFHAAMEDTVRDTLRAGLRGWEVIDCVVTLTQSGYQSPGTGRRDFRYLTPLVVMSALREAGTIVCEPVRRFELELPSDTVRSVLDALSRLTAAPREIKSRGSSLLLVGDISAVKMRELQRLLPRLTRGEGVLESSFHHYQPTRGEAPSRPRRDRDALNRGEYLRQILPRF
ncbi:MAG: GTP-binding protein, partial [Actinomycetota bacterium]|nr:GTP-binding protein [Actinomycetota bacterium]